MRQNSVEVEEAVNAVWTRLLIQNRSTAEKDALREASVALKAFDE